MTDPTTDMMTETDTGVTDMTEDFEVMMTYHMTLMTETDIEADTMMGEGEPERILVGGL